MNYDLKEIFRAITPDSIKGVPVIDEVLHIFIETLQQRAKQSLDMSSYMENKNIRKELFKTYLGDLYDVLEGIKSNQKVIDLITERNKIYGDTEGFEFISRDVVNDMVNRINDEHFVAFKNFREKKGTIKAIEYIFHLIATLVNSPDGIGYVIIEGKGPFELMIEGTLPAEFYYYLVAPLAHPAGYTYQYAQAVAWELIDYFFPISREYNVKQLDINCISKNPENPNVDIKTTTDFSDRIVIDIKENNYIWPKSTKIYFGGEHQGEYLENLIYANGDSTVKLYDESGLILTFGDYCTISRVIETIIIQDPVCNYIINELHPFLDDNFNLHFDGELVEKDPEEETIFLHSLENSKTPYLSWEKIPWWSAIGSYPYKWDKWNHSCHPDAFNDDQVMHIIGDDHMFVWGKLEKIGGQFLNEHFENIPNRSDENLYGYTRYKNNRALLINPSEPFDGAYIRGDAFHITYKAHMTRINDFFIKDEIGSYIIPDVFELSNGAGKDDLGLENNDETVRFNSFIVRDDEFAHVYFDDQEIGKFNNYFMNGDVLVGPSWFIKIDEWDIGGEKTKRVSLCNTKRDEIGQILTGKEWKIKKDKWFVGGAVFNAEKQGFWYNTFSDKSEEFDFGVYRDGKKIPDNNVNLPINIDKADDYSLSFDGQVIKVFSENSDNPYSITVYRDGIDQGNNFRTSVFSFDDKYYESFGIADLIGQQLTVEQRTIVGYGVDGVINTVFSNENNDFLTVSENSFEEIDLNSMYSMSFEQIKVGDYKIGFYKIDESREREIFGDFSDSIKFNL